MKPVIPAALCTGLALLSCSQPAKDRQAPNIVFILADDLGYGDISCLGQAKFATPNIDRLSRQGMLFRQHYAGTTVSAPSRSSLMTGLHTGHTPVRGNKSWEPEGNWPLPEGSITMGKILKSKGYVTGAFGKWGLGYIDTEGAPDLQGIDEFYGYNCQSLAHNYYPDHLWHNREKIMLHENDSGKTGAYSPDLIHAEALKFMERNKSKPFFLFYPTTIPHAELFAPEKYMQMFRGRFDPEKSYKGVDDGPQFRLGPYGSQPESHAAFAAMVTALDNYVGGLMAKLEELGIQNNTIVLFSSDNGPHLEGGADPDYFKSNGPFRGYKRDMHEGGIRVPLIVRWPGKVRENTVSDHVSAFWDILPTFADIIGAETPAGIDGISFLPELLGKKQKEHDYLYWEFHEQGGKAAVRKGDWKAIRLNADQGIQEPIELYDLSNDPGEMNDLSGSNPAIVKQMIDLMKEAHVKSDVFPFSYEKQ